MHNLVLLRNSKLNQLYHLTCKFKGVSTEKNTHALHHMFFTWVATFHSTLLSAKPVVDFVVYFLRRQGCYT
jgi:hypothetical protein